MDRVTLEGYRTERVDNDEKRVRFLAGKATKMLKGKARPRGRALIEQGAEAGGGAMIAVLPSRNAPIVTRATAVP